MFAESRVFWRPFAALFASGLATLLAACSGESNTVPPPVAGLQAMRALASAPGTGTIVVPVQVAVSVVPSPLPVAVNALSATAHSVRISIDNRRTRTFSVGDKVHACVKKGAFFNCALSLSAAVGSHTLTLAAYASPDGTGQAVASGTTMALVYSGYDNYPQQFPWTEYATKIGLSIQSPPVAGVASTMAVAAYAEDAGGAYVPSGDPIGPGGAPVGKVNIAIKGWANKKFGRQSLFTPVTVSYGGISSLVEHLSATAASPKVSPAATTLPLLPGSSAKAKLFVSVIDPSTQSLRQFAAGASGTASPIRFFDPFKQGTLFAASDDGSYWTWTGSYVLHWGRGGKIIEYLPPYYPGGTPGNQPFIAGGALDENGNLYVIEDLAGFPSRVNVYLANQYELPPSRFVNVNEPASFYKMSLLQRIAVDGSGDIFVPYVGSSTPGYGAGVFVYAPGASGDDPPARTVTLAALRAISVDAAGNLYVLACSANQCGNAQTSLVRYAPDGTPSTLFAQGGNAYIRDIAADASGNVFLALYQEVSNNPSFDTLSVGELAHGGSALTNVLPGIEHYIIDDYPTYLAVAP